MQVLEEHVKVFEMNNTIIKDFPVRTQHAFRAVQRILPPEIILTGCAAIFALLMMWVTPKIMEAARIYEASFSNGGTEATSTDPIDTLHTRSQEL